jgi:hypothetical protein
MRYEKKRERETKNEKEGEFYKIREG